jgi:hypothetical protein
VGLAEEDPGDVQADAVDLEEVGVADGRSVFLSLPLYNNY